MSKILNLNPKGPERACANIDEFLLGLNCSYTLPADDQEMPLVEPMLFSNKDRAYFWSFQKTYFANSSPGVRTPAWTSIRRQNECCILYEEGCEGLVMDNSGGLVNATGPYYKKTSSSILEYDNSSVRVNEVLMKNATELDESVIVFYDEHLQNYYHWWLECLLRLNLIINVFGVPAKTFAHGPKSRVKGWRAKSLHIVDRNVIYPRTSEPHVIRPREVIWCNNYSVEQTPQYAYRSLAEMVRRRVVSTRPSIVGVFIERETSRQFINGDAIRGLMDRLGIRMQVLDKMEQVEEIELFRSCRIIIGVQGAGLANMLFADPGTCVLELMPSAEVRDHFWMLASKLGHRYGTVICESDGPTNDSALKVDIEVLERAVDFMLNY